MTDAGEAPRNKAVLRAVFDATAKGDGRPFYDALADDVRWTIIGTTAWSKTYEGKREVASRLLAPLAAQFEGSNIVSADRLLAEGDTVVVEGRNHSRTKRGDAYGNRYCWVIVMRDGQMSEITEYTDTDLISRVLDAPG